MPTPRHYPPTMDAEEDRPSIDAIYRELDRLIGSRPGPSPDILVAQTATCDVLIKGNSEGMLWLAAAALRVAMAERSGYHEHIDEASFASAGSIPLVLERL